MKSIITVYLEKVLAKTGMSIEDLSKASKVNTKKIKNAIETVDFKEQTHHEKLQSFKLLIKFGYSNLKKIEKVSGVMIDETIQVWTDEFLQTIPEDQKPLIEKLLDAIKLALK